MPGISFTLLFDLGIILIAATIFNYVARLLKQPPLLAYVGAGLFIGPLVLGAFKFSFLGIPIGVTTTEDILLLSELGVAFLLFSVGIETDLRKLLEFGKVAVLGTLLQVGLTTASVFLLNILLGLLSFEQSLYLGLVLAFSSTTIVVKMLSDYRQINTLHGRLMIGFLLMQDLLVILVLPLIENISNIFAVNIALPLITNVLAILAIAYVLNRFIYPTLFSFATQSEELLFLSAMSSVFIFIFLSYIFGLSIAVGAFVGGVALSTLPYNLEVLHKIRGVRDFLATIFFVTLGIQITPTFVSFPLALAIAILAIVFVFKPLIFYLITALSGYGGRVSITVALGLAQVSEFSFIIASQGKDILQQTAGLYSFVILVIATSMALSPYLFSSTPAIYSFINSYVEKFASTLKKSEILHRKLAQLEHIPRGMHGHAIIFGGGTVGSNIAATIKERLDVVLVDSDSKVVFYNIEKGINCVYGSIDNPEIWEKIHLESARVIILAIPFAKPSLQLIKHIRQKKPEIMIFARAHHFKDALMLYDVGVDYVVMPQVIGGNLFVKKIVQYLNNGSIDEINNFRHEMIEYLREKSREEDWLRTH